jgi:hypothetical protein
MKRYLAVLLWLMLALACSAAEIVAWKVPLNRYAWDGLNSKGVVRLKSAPESSPFFKEGDELWDLRGIPARDSKLALDWLVWNASSGRLIAKANWAAISALNDILLPGELPEFCRLTVSLYQVPADGGPLKDDAPPVAELTTVSRSGKQFTSTWTKDEKMMSLESEVSINMDDRIADGRLVLKASVPGQARIEVNTEFIQQTGAKLWLARDYDGKAGLDIVVSVSPSSADGSNPEKELLMIQKGDDAMSLGSAYVRWNEPTIRIGEFGWLTRVRADQKLLQELLSNEKQQPQVDPFGDCQVPPVELPRLEAIVPPAILRPWLDHEVLDAREWGKKINAAMMGPDTFIGYDPIAGCLYFYSPDKQKAKVFGQNFAVLDGDLPPLVIATLEGPGQVRLLSKSGQKAGLTRTTDGNQETRGFEFEPTIRENDNMIDMRMFFSDKPNPQQAVHLNTSFTLNAGQSLEVFSGTGGEAEKTGLTMKAEILRAKY